MSPLLIAAATAVAAALPIAATVVLARRAEAGRVERTARARAIPPDPEAPRSRVAWRAATGSTAVPRRLAEPLLRRLEARRWRAGLPEALEAVARELRAGAPPRRAMVEGLRSVGGPFLADAAQVQRRFDAGRSVPETVQWWVSARRSDELAPLAPIVAAGVELGVGLAAAIEGLAATVSDRRDVAAEAAAGAAQARASALLLVVAPGVFLVVMSGVEPGATRFLFGSPVGWLTLLAALVSDVVGAWWMYRLTEAVR
jgi:tight adherence protein B